MGSAPISRVFEFRPIDLAGFHWGGLHLSGGNTSAAANVTFELPDGGPLDHAIYLSHVQLECDPGAGQNVDRIECLLIERTAGNRQFKLFLDNNDGAGWAANATIYRQFQCDLLWDPEEDNLRIEGIFNAGAAANTVRLRAHGIYMPKGNAKHGF